MVLLRPDMIDFVGQLNTRLRHLAIFAAVPCTLPNKLSHPGRRHALGSLFKSEARAFACSRSRNSPTRR